MIKTDEPIVVEQTFDRSIKDVWQAITVLDKIKTDQHCGRKFSRQYS